MPSCLRAQTDLYFHLCTCLACVSICNLKSSNKGIFFIENIEDFLRTYDYGDFIGGDAEKLCYNDLKEYFSKNGDTAVIIHGLNLHKRDGKTGEGSEKDFIIVNYTHRYIMPIEVKHNLTGEYHSLYLT